MDFSSLNILNLISPGNAMLYIYTYIFSFQWSVNACFKQAEYLNFVNSEYWLNHEISSWLLDNEYSC